MPLDTFHKEIIERLARLEITTQATYDEAKKTNGRVTKLESDKAEETLALTHHIEDIERLKVWRDKKDEKQEKNIARWVERGLWLAGLVMFTALSKLDILNVNL